MFKAIFDRIEKVVKSSEEEAKKLGTIKIDADAYIKALQQIAEDSTI